MYVLLVVSEMIRVEWKCDHGLASGAVVGHTIRAWWLVQPRPRRQTVVNRPNYQIFTSFISASLSRFLPESPRWLCSQGRHKEAYSILRKMAMMNGRNFTESDDENLLHSLELPSKVCRCCILSFADPSIATYEAAE